MAVSTIPNTFNQNFERQSVSVLEYAKTLSEGVHFYSTPAKSGDSPFPGNPPSTGSYAFMIFVAASGITIFALQLGSRGAYINASSSGGQAYSGWKEFTIT